MSEKPEALRLVNVFAVEKELRRQHAEIERLHDELRRQHAKIERLMEALEIIAGYRQCVNTLTGIQDFAEATLRREYV